VLRNLPAHNSISAFILNPSIRNNTLSVGDQVRFNFVNFEDKIGTVTYKSNDVNNVTSYICKFKEFQFSQVFINVNTEEYLISIDIPEQNRKLITYLSNDRLNYYLVELDTANLDVVPCNDSLIKMNPEVKPVEKKILPDTEKLPKEEKDNLKSQPLIQEQAFNNTGCNSLGENDSATFKVLIIYTQAALTFAGSQAAMNNLVAQSITRANNAAINSNLGMNFVLAHAELTTYIQADGPAGGSSTDLSRLRNKTDTFMDNVHTLRNTYAADFVHLFSFISDTGGLGFLLNTLSGNEDLAFALSRVQQLSFTDTFIHELGHNMSASHASGQSVQPGPTGWADWPGNNWTAGWRFQGNNNTYYTSLMAYNSGSSWPDGISSTNISYFSTPLLLFQGQPIGNAVSGDNSRSLKATKHVVSKYRDETTLLYCAASANNASNLNLSISNLSLNGLTNPSTWASFNDFSYKRTCLTKGQTYPLTVNVAGGFSGAKLWVWVDWNNDTDFTDAGEQVLNSATGSTLQYNVNVTPPPSAIIGEVRMRIRYEVVSQPTFTASPCGASSFGEVEDYTIVVQDANVATDTDGDGVADASDLDSDNDGILNSIELAGGITPVDTDSDTIPNHLDLDSDNDGIPDNVEAQNTVGYNAPANDTPATYLANNGINSVYIANPITPVDSDGDGVPDYLDSDSDNDGLTDLAESFNPLPAGIVGQNGLLASAESADNYTNVNGLAYNGTTFTLLDTDNDVPNGADYNYRDIPQTQNYSGTQIISSFASATIVPNKKDAYLNIISSNLGVVITRVNGASTINNPVEGMIIYDTSDNTFKVNTTGTTAGWRAFGN
jgi:hypothetical protein